MTRLSFCLLATLCLTTACGSDIDPFLSELQAQGTAQEATAQQWEDALEMINEGQEQIAEGKEQIADAREMMDEADEAIEEGRRMVREGERLKALIETQYLRSQQRQGNIVPTVPYPGY